MHAAAIIIATSILAIVAYYDLLTRRIPNTLSIGIAALGLIRMALAANPVAVCYTLAATIMIFVATFLLFWRGIIGGGDAKLIAGMALLIGHQELLTFLLLMSLAGGSLALIVIAHDRVNPALNRVWRLAVEPSRAVTGPPQPGTEKKTVPYGVAIAAAGAITLMIAR